MEELNKGEFTSKSHSATKLLERLNKTRKREQIEVEATLMGLLRCYKDISKIIINAEDLETYEMYDPIEVLYLSPDGVNKGVLVGVKLIDKTIFVRLLPYLGADNEEAFNIPLMGGSANREMYISAIKFCINLIDSLNLK